MSKIFFSDKATLFRDENVNIVKKKKQGFIYFLSIDYVCNIIRDGYVILLNHKRKKGKFWIICVDERKINNRDELNFFFF